jgi:CHAT domain-containing protein/tetratricopeptide (TPR) repeat protein
MAGEIADSLAEIQATMAIDSLTNQGKYEEAILIANKLIEEREKKYGASNQHTLTMLGKLGAIYQAMKRYDKAEPILRQVYEEYAANNGANGRDALLALQALGLLYQRMNRYDEAEASLRRVFEEFAAAAGPDDETARNAQSWLGQLYTAAGRHAEAEANLKAVLAENEKQYGRDHFQTLVSVYYLAAAYSAGHRYREAGALYERAIQGIEKIEKKSDLAVTALQVSLDGLGAAYAAEGRYADAATVYKRLLGAREKALGKDDMNTLATVSALATVEMAQGRLPAAEALFKRLVATNERLHGKRHPDTLEALNRLALVYRAQGKGGEAQGLSGRAAEAAGSTLGEDHPQTLQNLAGLAAGYATARRYAEAEALWRRIVAAKERTLGKDSLETADSTISLAQVLVLQGRGSESAALTASVSPTVERALASGDLLGILVAGRLGDVYRAEGRFAEAEPLLKGAVDAAERVLGAEHPLFGRLLGAFGRAYFEQGDWRYAAPMLRRATGILARNAQRGGQDADTGGSARKPEDESGWGEFSQLFVKALYRLEPGEDVANEARARKTFEAVQWAFNSQAAAALAQMAARGANGDPKLAPAVRERQDLSAEWRRLDHARVAALALPADKRDAEAEARASKRLSAIDARLEEIDGRLAAEFPAYVSLTSPAVMQAEEAQAQLGADEALVVIADTPAVKQAPEETFVWVLTRTELRWARSALGGASLMGEAEALRCGLDAAAWIGNGARRCQDALGVAEPDGTSLPFDLARAHRLYKALFGPFEEQIKGKNLLLVLPEPLARLPLNALVTADPDHAGLSAGTNYRSAAWLARSHAVTVLPSVFSLRALRGIARPSAATKPLIGFGNPLLEGDPGQPAGRSQAELARGLQTCQGPVRLRIAATGRSGVPVVKRGGGLADVALIRSLAPLPETAGELCEVARGLGADPAEIRLGARSTEREVKALSARGELAQYKIVHFATHGVLPDQIEEVSEPGLILTPPSAASAADDGYLSASEVASLKLDADWVILSACNTAGAGAGGGEALSGLARAFMYAQARALLVSHWEVDSAATVKLITSAVDMLARDRSIGRAGAMRRAMLAVMDDGAPHEAHPSYWAPFVLVGEGRR